MSFENAQLALEMLVSVAAGTVVADRLRGLECYNAAQARACIVLLDCTLPDAPPVVRTCGEAARAVLQQAVRQQTLGAVRAA